MNPFLNFIQSLAAGPAATGSAVTGYVDPTQPMPLPSAPAVMPADPPMPPPAPPQAERDRLALGGDVLAVIDPTRLRRENEDKSLFQSLSETLTGGGLTADGRGRSKGGAFAHGFASGANAQGAARARARERDEDRALKAQDAALRARKQDTDERYWNHRMRLDERTQAWRETPDAPAPGNMAGVGSIYLARARAFQENLRAMGVSDPRIASDAQIRQAQAAVDADPRLRLPNVEAQGAQPAAQPAPQAQPAPAPAPAPQPARPPAAAPAPATQFQPGQRARNPQTNEVIEWNGSAWVPAR